jgi:hypothetical protein
MSNCKRDSSVEDEGCIAKSGEESNPLVGMSRLALLGLLTIAACSLEKGGLGVGLDDSGSQSSTFGDGSIAPPTEDAGDGTSMAADASSDVVGPQTGIDTGAPPVDATPTDDAPVDDDAGLDADSATDAAKGKDATAPDAADARAEDAPVDAPADATVDSPGPVDAAPPPPDAPPPPSCVSGIPAGWTVAVYDLGPDACPATFPEHDVETAPTIGATACSCSCDVTQDGSCTDGTLATSGDTLNALACGNAWFSVPIVDSTCTTIPTDGATIRDVPLSFQAQPLAPQPGTCASTLIADPTQLSTSPARYCDVPPAAAESVCNGIVPSGFAACIASPGSKACPAGSPFTHPFPVETAADVRCSACTTCAVDTTCANAVLTVHTGAKCGDVGVSFDVDGTCDPSGFIGAKAVTAVEYTADEASTCTAGSSTASALLTGAVTLCCL